MRELRLVVPRPAPDKAIDRYLSKHVPGLSIERARALLADGCVRAGGKLCRDTRRLFGGEDLVISFPPPVRSAAAEDTGEVLPILYEDASLVVVDKPAGLVVEPTKGMASVVSLLAARCTGCDTDGIAEPGVVHRLDRQTSGCLALPKTDDARVSLLGAFEAKQIDKRYLAIVLGSPKDEERLEGPYSRDPKDPRKFTTHVQSARRAALTYYTRARGDGVALVEVKLETGRTHQIRVQLSEAGYAVLGDAVYGPREAREHPQALALGRHALHAYKLSLPHPLTGTRIDAKAELPPELKSVLAALSL